MFVQIATETKEGVTFLKLRFRPGSESFCCPGCRQYIPDRKIERLWHEHKKNDYCPLLFECPNCNNSAPSELWNARTEERFGHGIETLSNKPGECLFCCPVCNYEILDTDIKRIWYKKETRQYRPLLFECPDCSSSVESYIWDIRTEKCFGHGIKALSNEPGECLFCCPKCNSEVLDKNIKRQWD